MGLLASATNGEALGIVLVEAQDFLLLERLVPEYASRLGPSRVLVVENALVLQHLGAAMLGNLSN